jgi:hypothetical protein
MSFHGILIHYKPDSQAEYTQEAKEGQPPNPTMHAVMEKGQKKKAPRPQNQGGKHHTTPGKRPTHLIKSSTTPV